MAKSVIYNLDYGVFQFYKDGEIVFNNEMPEGEIVMAVIDKEIKFKLYPDFSSEAAFKKFVKKVYGDKNLFYFKLKDGYGIYLISPANSKKYYRFGKVDTVIPYEYLVIKFSETFSRKSLMFMEFSGGFIRIAVIHNGFSLLPAWHVPSDNLQVILSDLYGQLNAKNIRINTVLTNNGDPVISRVIQDANIITYEHGEFYRFHESMGGRFPYFKNLDENFKEKEKRNNIKNWILLLVSLIILSLSVKYALTLRKEVAKEKVQIEFFKSRINFLNLRIHHENERLVINGIKKYPKLNIVIKDFLELFPKGIIIKSIEIRLAKTKQGRAYMLKGAGTTASLNGFISKYNSLDYALSRYGFKLNYRFTDYGLPYFVFSGNLAGLNEIAAENKDGGLKAGNARVAPNAGDNGMAGDNNGNKAVRAIKNDNKISVK